MVKPIREHKKHKKFVDVLFPAIPDPKPVLNKKCYFQKINDYHSIIDEKYRRLLHENLLLNKHKNTSKSSYSKQFFENISNNKLLGITLTKDSYMSMKSAEQNKTRMQNDFLKSSNTLWMRREIQKLVSVKQQQEHLQRDIDYVINLKDFK